MGEEGGGVAPSSDDDGGKRARATDDRPACCKPDAPERLSGGAFEEICARLASRVAV